MNKDLKEDYSKCDYYSTFIKSAVTQLKNDGLCYVFYKDQVDEILKYVQMPIAVKKNECGYTLNIPRNKRNYVRKEIL